MAGLGSPPASCKPSARARRDGHLHRRPGVVTGRSGGAVRRREGQRNGRAGGIGERDRHHHMPSRDGFDKRLLERGKHLFHRAGHQRAHGAHFHLESVSAEHGPHDLNGGTEVFLAEGIETDLRADHKSPP